MEAERIEPALLSSSVPRWWSGQTVAVVTGANKGIGFAYVKQLAFLGFTVVLTARDRDRGQQAVDRLAALGLHVRFHLLDISDRSSVDGFASWFRDELGLLDILVNNAGVSFNEIGENSVEQAEIVLKTNFYGSKMVTEALLPLFRRSKTSTSRILNISSRLGSLQKVGNLKVRSLLEDEGLEVEGIEEVVVRFLDGVSSGRWREEGWPEVWTAYAVSKLALNAYSKLLAQRHRGQGLSINCICPGFTQTSMTRGLGSHSADAAAAVGLRLLLLPPQSLPTGKFFLTTSAMVSNL